MSNETFNLWLGIVTSLLGLVLRYGLGKTLTTVAAVMVIATCTVLLFRYSGVVGNAIGNNQPGNDNGVGLVGTESKDAPVFVLERGYSVQKVGNKLRITAPKGTAHGVHFAAYIGSANAELPKPDDKTLQKIVDGLFEYSIRDDLKNEELVVILRFPKVVGDWDKGNDVSKQLNIK